MKAVSALILGLVLLSGCGFQQAETMVLLDEEISEVNISKSNGFGRMNEDTFLTLKDEQSLKIMEQAITTATKQPGKVEVAEPEYDVMVGYQSKEGELPTHGIHLWLGKDNEKSMFMYITDDSVYTTSPKVSQQLRELLLTE